MAALGKTGRAKKRLGPSRGIQRSCADIGAAGPLVPPAVPHRRHDEEAVQQVLADLAASQTDGQTSDTADGEDRGHCTSAMGVVWGAGWGAGKFSGRLQGNWEAEQLVSETTPLDNVYQVGPHDEDPTHELSSEKLTLKPYGLDAEHKREGIDDKCPELVVRLPPSLLGQVALHLGLQDGQG